MESLRWSIGRTRESMAVGGAAFISAPLALFAVLMLGGLFCMASRTQAAVITDRPLLFEFNGSDTAAGAFADASNLEVEQATGDVYVVDSDRKVVDKFDAAGLAQDFASTGESSLDVPPTYFNFRGNIAIDNSSVNPGRIYLTGDEGPVVAFDPAGNVLWEIERGSLVTTPCAPAVDSQGHLWVSDRGSPQRVREFELANTGLPPKPTGSFLYTNGGSFPCSIDLDTAGNAYIAVSDTGKGVYKYTGGVGGASPFDPAPSNGVAVDQLSPTGHIFTSHQGDFNEYESSGALVGTFGSSVLSNGQGVAYSHALDRVYVANYSGHLVYAFGPVVTGTVPDVETEAATETGISNAKFNGTVNPQGIPNGYYFEWKRGTNPTEWGEAKSSPVQGLAEDSSGHSVSFGVSELRGNMTYQARLVGLNTTNGLRAVSNLVTFTTAKALAAPIVSIPDPTSVDTKSAQLNATIDPQQDFGTTYRFQISTDPACESGFADQGPPRELESATATSVSELVTGLLPAQHYCVRAVATNSFGSTTSGIMEFTTKATLASEVSVAFAAPRLDSSARLNARVNPEGAPLTYRFEYSGDGGSTWIALPDRESTSPAREQIVVAEELTGLEPNTTYRYRLALIENEAGPVSSLGGEKAFTTRTTAEASSPSPCPNEALRLAQHTGAYLNDCRGIELVNNPEKGTQNVRAESIQGTQPLSLDGERVVWNVLAGAPGGNIGAGAAFLASRTGPTASAPSGWLSRSVVPLAEGQAGGGEEGGYRLGVTTPELSAFVFNAGIGALENGESRRLVWIDASQNQRLLKEYSTLANAGHVDMTDDGGDVLLVDQAGFHQLLDINGSRTETVSLMPDGGINECGLDSSDENRSFVGGGGANGGGAAARLWQPGYHMAATTDASRVYFQAKPNGLACGSSLYGIYVRNRETGETTLVDPGTNGHSPNFIRATPDGRQAYFSTYSKLDLADTNADLDVYRWDEGAAASTCLTCVVLDADVAPSSRGVLVSDDFSHVYFESPKQLVPGEGKAGDLNVYSLSGGEVEFVADVNAGEGILQGTRLSGPALLSADGNTLVFETSSDPASHQELTADPLAQNCAQLKSTTPQPCEELVRYDDRDGSLECISCRFGGLTQNSVGVAEAPGGHEVKMSADGTTVAFTTAEALVPRDVNRTTDVYEWRNGVRGLLSDGVTTYPQSFTASPQLHAVGVGGRDILFSLADPNLTGFEQDGFANLYDARVGGGFFVPESPSHCSEESCQGPLQAAPSVDRISSSGFAGRGNAATHPKPRPCSRKRGKAKRRCITKHKKHPRSQSAQGEVGRPK